MVERKMAAPEGAAKFREETPRKGCDIANGEFAISRCNNMLCCNCVIKPRVRTI